MQNHETLLSRWPGVLFPDGDNLLEDAVFPLEQTLPKQPEPWTCFFPQSFLCGRFISRVENRPLNSLGSWRSFFKTLCYISSSWVASVYKFCRFLRNWRFTTLCIPWVISVKIARLFRHINCQNDFISKTKSSNKCSDIFEQLVLLLLWLSSLYEIHSTSHQFVKPTTNHWSPLFPTTNEWSLLTVSSASALNFAQTCSWRCSSCSVSKSVF